MTHFDHPDYQRLFGEIEQVREHRAAFLVEVRGGSLTVAEIFERASSDPDLASMKLLPALEALPDVGKVQTRRALEELGISEGVHIGDVKVALASQLPSVIERHAL